MNELVQNFDPLTEAPVSYIMVYQLIFMAMILSKNQIFNEMWRLTEFEPLFSEVISSQLTNIASTHSLRSYRAVLNIFKPA